MFDAVDASTPTNVENRASITTEGAGTRGIEVGNSFGGDVTVTNRGVIVTGGGPHTRGGTYTGNNPYRRADGIFGGVDGGSGDITLANHGSVTAKGQGARGLSASVDDGGTGHATVHNYGTVKTEGEPWTPQRVRDIEPQKYRAYGVFATTNEGGGTAEVVNQQGASITTMGQEARGLFAYSGGETGTATATNRGTVTTHGTDARGVSANTDGRNGATIKVTNEGTVTTHGDRGHGLYSWAGRDDNQSGVSTVTASNTGTITTNGAGADGTAIYSPIGRDPSSGISLVNTGTITTNGRSSDGLEAGMLGYITGDSDALGTISVENSGTVTVNGDADSGGWINGISAFYWANTNPNDGDSGGSILNSGDIEVENTGTVTVHGHRGVGVRSKASGTGDIDLSMRGSVVTAGSAGDADTSGTFGIGIFAHADTAETADDAADDIDVMILVSGSSVIRAFGATEDDSGTTDYDETKGIGIIATTGASTGHSVVTVSDGASVSAQNGLAVMFEGGKGTLNFDRATLVGDIKFTDRDDIFNVMESGGSVTGQINFGRGDDTMNVNVAADRSFDFNGDIIGLETMNKTGAGLSRFGGDVTFEGSALNLDEGMLVIAGHMNLGNGEVTIKQAGKLTFEVDADGTAGSVTAGSVHFEGVDADDVSVYTQISEDVSDDKLDAVRTALASSTPVLIGSASITSGASSSPTAVSNLTIRSESANGSVTAVGTVAGGTGTATFDSDMVRHIGRLSISDSTGGTAALSATGGSSNRRTVLGLGLLAILVASYLADDDGNTGFAEDYLGKPQSAYMSSVSDRGVLTVRESADEPYRLWIRTGKTVPAMSMTDVSGTEIGLSLYHSEDFYINASMTPDVTAEAGSLNLAVQGEAYSLSSGWQGDRYFAGFRVSHGRFELDSIVNNPVVNSSLVSNARLRATQAQLGAGLNMDVDQLRFIPSASVQAGTFKQDGHVAESPALTARIPAFEQKYTAVRLGLKVTSRMWLSFANEGQWKPHLRFDAIRTNSKDSGTVSLRQSDRLGVMSFNTPARVRPMPSAVSALGFGARMKTSKSTDSEWKLGYAGIVADGEYYHAAMLGYKLRF